MSFVGLGLGKGGRVGVGLLFVSGWDVWGSGSRGERARELVVIVERWVASGMASRFPLEVGI